MAVIGSGGCMAAYDADCKNLDYAQVWAGVIYAISFDLSSMERGELRHDQCVTTCLTDCMQDIGAAKPNVGGWCTGSVLKSGVW